MKPFKQLVLLFLLTAFTLCACNHKQEVPPTSINFSIGVIQTASQTGRTNFLFYDSSLTCIHTLRTNYGLVGQYGYGMPCVKDGVMYELSLGNDYTKDFGTVLALTLQTGAIKEYKFDRVNLTDLSVTKDYIYTISNLNQITYIDRYSFSTKTIDSVEVKGNFLLNLCVYKNELYAFGGDLESYDMYQVDFEKHTCTAIYDLSNWYLGQGDPNYFAEYHDCLYFPCQDKLLQYSPTTNKLKEYSLPYDNAWGLVLQNDNLYISCVDRFSENASSKILVFNPDTEEITSTYELDTSIMQFTIQQNTLYILNQSGLYQYHLDSNNRCTLQSQAKLTSPAKDIHVSGMFLNSDT